MFSSSFNNKDQNIPYEPQALIFEDRLIIENLTKKVVDRKAYLIIKNSTIMIENHIKKAKFSYYTERDRTRGNNYMSLTKFVFQELFILMYPK